MAGSDDGSWVGQAALEWATLDRTALQIRFDDSVQLRCGQGSLRLRWAMHQAESAGDNELNEQAVAFIALTDQRI